MKNQKTAFFFSIKNTILGTRVPESVLVPVWLFLTRDPHGPTLPKRFISCPRWNGTFWKMWEVAWAQRTQEASWWTKEATEEEQLACASLRNPKMLVKAPKEQGYAKNYTKKVRNCGPPSSLLCTVHNSMASVQQDPAPTVHKQVKAVDYMHSLQFMCYGPLFVVTQKYDFCKKGAKKAHIIEQQK